MTGKIGSLNPLDSCGSIEVDNGSRVRFKFSTLLAYDLGRIAVGQFVTFDLKDRNENSEAVNLSIRAAPDGKALPLPAVGWTRFLGFDSLGDVRRYRFERVALGQTIQKIQVRLDLDLLRRHHVALQDGLDLCCQALEHRLRATPEDQRSLELVLSESEIAAHREIQMSRTRSRQGLRKAFAAPAAVGF